MNYTTTNANEGAQPRVPRDEAGVLRRRRVRRHFFAKLEGVDVRRPPVGRVPHEVERVLRVPAAVRARAARQPEHEAQAGAAHTTKERLGKNIGVQLIRVLKVTGAAAQIDAAERLQQEMGHGPRMQKKYISRGGWDH